MCFFFVQIESVIYNMHDFIERKEAIERLDIY